MSRWLWVIVPVLIFSSCGEKVSNVAPPLTMEKPSDLIPEDKMIQILADVHLLEGAIGFNTPRPPSIMPNITDPSQLQQLPALNDQKSIPYFDIFKKHGCTRDQYEQSFRWYSMDPAQFTLMYDEVINELTRRQAKEQGTLAPQPGDSVK